MIRLTSSFQAARRKNHLPQRALTLLAELEQQNLPTTYDHRTSSFIAVMEQHDDIERTPRELGRYGLMEVLDNPWRSYDSITAFAEGDQRYYEMVATLRLGVVMHLLIPDAPWVDSRLRLVLEVDSSERHTGGS